MDIKGLGAKVAPRFPMPTFGQTVEILVYVIHTAPDPESYFFVFDFEEFIERTRAGMFARPKIVAFAGRRDFGQLEFSRQFRAEFAAQFEIARAQLADQQTTRQGVFGWLRDLWGKGLGDFAAQLVLLVALSAGRAALAQVGRAHWLAGKSDARQLEEAIAETQTKVDAALAALEVKLHPELYDHAWRGQTPGPSDGLDRDAWPLPAFVRLALR